MSTLSNAQVAKLKQRVLEIQKSGNYVDTCMALANVLAKEFGLPPGSSPREFVSEVEAAAADAGLIDKAGNLRRPDDSRGPNVMSGDPAMLAINAHDTRMPASRAEVVVNECLRSMHAGDIRPPSPGAMFSIGAGVRPVAGQRRAEALAGELGRRTGLIGAAFGLEGATDTAIDADNPEQVDELTDLLKRLKVCRDAMRTDTDLATRRLIEESCKIAESRAATGKKHSGFLAILRGLVEQAEAECENITAKPSTATAKPPSDIPVNAQLL